MIRKYLLCFCMVLLLLARGNAAADAPSRETVAGWLQQQEQLVRTLHCTYQLIETETQPDMIERLKELDRLGKIPRIAAGPGRAQPQGPAYQRFVWSKENAEKRSFRAKAWHKGTKEREEHYRLTDDATKEPFLTKAFDGQLVRTIHQESGRRNGSISDRGLDHIPRMNPNALAYRFSRELTWSEFVAKGRDFASATIDRDGQRYSRIVVRHPTWDSLFLTLIFDKDQRLIERRLNTDGAPPAEPETRRHFRFLFHDHKAHPGAGGATIWFPHRMVCQYHQAALPDGSPIITLTQTVQIQSITFNSDIPDAQFVPDMLWSFSRPEATLEKLPLGGPAPQPKATHFDLHGDPLPLGAVARLGTTRLRHGQVAYRAAFSPDGKLLATGGYDNVIRLWDTATGKEVRQLLGHRAMIRSLAFTPDGTRLFSASGAEFNDTQDNTIRLWDVATGRELRRFVGHQRGVRSIALSPDGQRLVSVSFDYNVCLWETETGKLVRRLDVPDDSVHFTAFSPDGRTVALGRNQNVVFWDTVTGTMGRTLEGAQVAGTFSPDGKVFVAQWGRYEDKQFKRTQQLWDVATGQPLRELEAPPGHANSFAFTPDGKTVLASLGGGRQDEIAVVCWDVATGHVTQRLKGGHQYEYYYAVAVSPDGKTVAAGNTRSKVTLWDRVSGEQLFPYRGHAAWISTVAWSPDGKTLASGSPSGEKEIWLWEAATGKPLRALEAAGHVEAVVFAPDGKTLATASTVGPPTVWDVANGNALNQYLGGDRRWDVIAFSADGKSLAAGGWFNQRAHVWDVATGKELRAFPRNDGRGLAYSADGRLLAMTDREGGKFIVRVWNTATGKEVQLLTGFDGPLQYLAFSPDGKTLASVGGEGKHHFGHGRSWDTKVRLWEVLTGKERAAFDNSVGGSWSATFAPNGRLLATGGDDTLVRLRDLAADRECRQLAGHLGSVTSMAFAPDGQRLASSSTDTTVLVWDVSVQAQPAPAEVSLSPDQLSALWADLGGADARKAYRAFWSLTAAPRQAVAFLRERVQPVSPVVPEPIRALLTDLENERFAVRQQAGAALAKVAHAAEPALRRALARNRSADFRAHAEKILDNLDHPLTVPERLQALRSIEVLEQIGTAEARQLLTVLAKGTPESRVTQEARAVDDRWARRVKP